MATTALSNVTLDLGDSAGGVNGLAGLDGNDNFTPTGMVDPTNPRDLTNLQTTQALIAAAIAAVPSFASTTILSVQSALPSLAPVAVDSEINVPFGPPVTNSFVSLTIDGGDTEASIITFLVTGEFYVRPIISVGRTTSAGDVIIELQVFKNGVAVVDGVFSRLLAEDESAVTVAFPPILSKFISNDTLQLKFSRSSVGMNDGQLEQYIPTNPNFVTRPLSTLVIKNLV